MADQIGEAMKSSHGRKAMPISDVKTELLGRCGNPTESYSS